MTPEFLLLDQKSELLPYRDAILELFRACFGKDLDRPTWDWAYLDNPMGEPFVSLCFADGRLVGHYAVIPYNLVHRGRKFRACLSMTTMVDATYRKYGLFTEQAQQVYEKAREAGIEAVFGFPNSKSTPGFRKRLGWVLGDPDFVAAVTVKELAASPGFRKSLLDPTLVRIDRNDPVFLKWRLAKPQQQYRNVGPVITKAYLDQEDMVFCERIDIETGDSSQRYNVFVDANVTDLKPQGIFEYQFGYRPLADSAVGLKFKKDLIMSDVF